MVTHFGCCGLRPPRQSEIDATSYGARHNKCPAATCIDPADDCIGGEARRILTVRPEFLSEIPAEQHPDINPEVYFGSLSRHAGAGFIGSHTVEELVRRGESVRVLDDLSTGRKENLSSVMGKIDFREGDIRDLEAIRPHFEGVNYVNHFAAASSVLRSINEPVETTQVNLMGTLNVLLAARDAHVKRMTMAATGAVYGDNPVLPRVETQMPDPMSPYAVVKLAGEYFGKIFYRLFGLEFVALRYFNIFGPGRILCHLTPACCQNSSAAT